MRTFELSTRITLLKRRKGRTATAAAAYRACCVIECDREGRTHDYTRKRGLEASQIILPKGSPEWAADRAKLWNAAEMRERNGVRGKNARAFKPDANTAREFMFTFPAELSAAGRLKVAETIARHFADTHGVAADFAIHQPGKDGDQHNHHCHLLTTTRRMTAKGLTEKAREWDVLKTGSILSKKFRAFVADTMNDAIAEEGKAKLVRVEHRSFKARGSSQVPTRHRGVARTNIKRKEQKRTREAWERANRKDQRARHAKELAALKTRQEFALTSKLGQLAERERFGIEAIRKQLARDQANDRAPAGASRLFQIATGQAMRSDFDRAARSAERLATVEHAIGELKASLQAERSKYADAQVNERSALTDRHRAEDRQLRQAVTLRADFDRAAEVEARREQVRSIQRENALAHDIEREGRDLTPA
jgi:hypothetical protein